MADDLEHEREAAEWCEALIDDSPGTQIPRFARNDKSFAKTLDRARRTRS
jgi:hypothetical protein